jgi:hypothetical protein
MPLARCVKTGVAPQLAMRRLVHASPPGALDQISVVSMKTQHGVSQQHTRVFASRNIIRLQEHALYTRCAAQAMQYGKVKPKGTRHLLVQRHAFRITEATIINVDEQIAKHDTKFRLEQRAALARHSVEVLDYSLNAGNGRWR